MVGSVLVAAPGSVHSTFIEHQLLIIPQQHPWLMLRPGEGMVRSVLVATPGSVHS